jgi:hypothetical protein
MFRVRKSNELKWVGGKSAGPLIVVGEHVADTWTGEFGDDHDRARAVDHYLGLLLVNDSDALVLGDDPFETTWVPLPSSGGGMFVRRLWSDTHQTALRAAHAIPPEAWSFEERPIEVDSGPLLLFDSARPGHAPRSVIRIQLPAGKYAIATADAEPDESTCVMAHRLLPIA